jgi:hypothetical protein
MAEHVNTPCHLKNSKFEVVVAKVNCGVVPPALVWLKYVQVQVHR